MAPALGQNLTEAPEVKATGSVGLIPAETFAAPSHMLGPKISPDGLKIVYRENIGPNKFLTIKALADKKIERIKIPDKKSSKMVSMGGK